MLHRAYSTITIKAVDEDARVIEGIASTPSTDRLGDVVEPKGANFTLPLPLLWQHQSDQPIGQVLAAKVTPEGILIRAQIAKGVLPRIDEAWALIKAGLVRGLSIGFKALETEQIKDTFGLRFVKWDWLELSAVTIAANADASITAIKSADLAALGRESASLHTPGVTGTRVVSVQTATRGTSSMTVPDQIKSFEATRMAKAARMSELMTKAGEAGSTLDATQAEEYDGLKAEVKSIDEHLARLADLEKANAAQARPVMGATSYEATTSRAPVITVTEPKLPPGIGFARSILCQAAARFENLNVMEVAKARYPSHGELHQFLMLKAAVPGATTTQTTWASPLVYAQNLTSEFIEFLRPQTIIGKFGTNGIPSLTRVPFQIRVPSQTNGGDAYWVGEGAPKPLTAFGYSTVTLTQAKVAAISVITRELARFSSPAAETLVRDALARAVVDRIDTDFVDPAHAVSAGISPASITNGLTALSSAGTSAANVVTDLTAIIADFVEAHYNVSNLVMIMPNTLSLALSLMTNSLGQPEFPQMTVNGGTLKGIPVIASQYAANLSGGGNLVICLSAPDIFLADDGNVTVDVSQEASLQMLDNPTNSAASATATTMVSMFQTNSMAIRAEREITWAKARTDAVVYMDDVNWGSVGSPA